MVEAYSPKPKNIITQVAIIILLIILNLILTSTIRYLTIDSGANSNSQLGAFLLSFFIPIFIISATPKMKPIRRVLKFGVGILVYSILILIIHGIAMVLNSGLLPSTFIILATLFFGERIKPFSLNKI